MTTKRCWCSGGLATGQRCESRLRESRVRRISCASRGKPSRPHELWIRSAWKRKGSGLRSSVEWAAKERKNLTRGRLARRKSAQEKRWDPSEKIGCQSRPYLAGSPALKPSSAFLPLFARSSRRRPSFTSSRYFSFMQVPRTVGAAASRGAAASFAFASCASGGPGLTGARGGGQV